VFFKLLLPPFFINLLKYVFESATISNCKSFPIAKNKKKNCEFKRRLAYEGDN
jgi:hypothetical protein